MSLRHGDIALVRWGGSLEPGVARYTDCDQDRRDTGADPEDLVDPHWAFFGTEWTLPVRDPVRLVKVLYLGDTIEQWKREVADDGWEEAPEHLSAIEALIEKGGSR